jgi:tetratricopeptide (TPR) repeat protein
MYRESLSICTSVLGANNPSTAIAANNLATLLTQRGGQERLQESKRLHEDVLATRMSLFGGSHLHTINSLHNLTFVLLELGDLEAAAQCGQQLKEAMGVWKHEHDGANHPDFSLCLQTLAEACCQGDEGDQAIQLYKDALAVCRELQQCQQLPPEHQITAVALHNLGQCLIRFEQETELARQCFQEALEMNDHLFGSDSTQVACNQVGLGELALEVDDEPQSAVALLEPAVERLLAVCPQHPDTAHALQVLAAGCMVLGRLDEAVQRQLQAVSILSGAGSDTSLAQALKIFDIMHGKMTG